MSETAEAYHNLKEILAHINDAYAPNTIRAYRADFSGWISFCTKKGACPPPVDPFIVSEFLLGLADAKIIVPKQSGGNARQ